MIATAWARSERPSSCLLPPPLLPNITADFAGDTKRIRPDRLNRGGGPYVAGGAQALTRSCTSSSVPNLLRRARQDLRRHGARQPAVSTQTSDVEILQRNQMSMLSRGCCANRRSQSPTRRVRFFSSSESSVSPLTSAVSPKYAAIQRHWQYPGHHRWALDGPRRRRSGQTRRVLDIATKTVPNCLNEPTEPVSRGPSDRSPTSSLPAKAASVPIEPDLHPGFIMPCLLGEVSAPNR